MWLADYVFVSVLFEFLIIPEYFIMENKMNNLLLESNDRAPEIILDNQVEIKPLILTCGFSMFPKMFGLPLLVKRDWSVSMKRKTKHTNFRLPCIAKIFLVKLLLDMYQRTYPKYW